MDLSPQHVQATTITASKSYTLASVTSADGTIIGYRVYGHGPGIVLVQGSIGSAHNFMQLAELLAKNFTVYVPDRRGRGLSLTFSEISDFIGGGVSQGHGDLYNSN